jgi:hypothetical protein
MSKRPDGITCDSENRFFSSVLAELLITLILMGLANAGICGPRKAACGSIQVRISFTANVSLRLKAKATTRFR